MRFVFVPLALSMLACADLVRAEGPPASRPTGLLSTHDRRAPQEPDAWPWTAIGRVNIVYGRSSRGFCTGVLVAPDKVMTAGHCLYDPAAKRWVEPKSVHYLAGAARDGFKAHGQVTSIRRDDGLDIGAVSHGKIPPEMLGLDWAILTLARPLDVKPVPLRAIADADLGATLDGGETARAGYGRDRPFLLSIQKGCAVSPIAGRPGLLAHDCDTMQGDSGSPLLLTRGGETWVIGLSTAVSSTFAPGVGHRAKSGIGVSATAFADRLGAAAP